MKLNKDQEKIVRHDGAQIVVAGAGTGKTEALTQHIMYLLLEKKYELREVVAMTFTEKAAAEMRERVYKAISEKVLSARDYEEKFRLDQLRRDFPTQNRITTIDGFNAGLLSAYPEYSPLPPDYQVVDDYSEFILETDIQRAFLQEIEKDELLLEQFLAFHEQMEQKKLLETIVELAGENADELRALQQDIPREQLEYELRKLIPLNEQSLWEDYVESLPDIPGDILPVLMDRENAISILTETGGFRTGWINKNEAYADLAESWPTETSKNFKAWREYLKKYALVFDAEKLSPDFFEMDWACHQALRKLAAMALLYQKVERDIIRRQGRVRFQDVAEAALEMLENHPAQLEEIRRGIRHLLVDEFQDTSLVQWNLIRLLRGENNVMLVGDPKQSIYRFRGADVTVFEKVRVREFAAGEQRELAESQRSCPGLVRFYNDLFAEVLSTQKDRPAYEAAHQDLKIAQHKQEASDQKTAKGGVTWIESTFEENEMMMTNPAAALAMFLRSLQEDARRISEGGSKVLLPQYQEISQKLAKKESGVIGVLFATHAKKKEAEKLLHAYDVQFSSYHGRGFYDSMPVLLAINLARFFNDPQDNLALTGILRSPLCGVTDPLIAFLTLQNEDMWQALVGLSTDKKLLPGDHHLFAQVTKMLKGWLDASRVLSFSDVLEKVWNESWLPFYFRLEDDGGQQEENFYKLVDILRNAQRDKEYGMAEIIAFLQTLRDKKAGEAEAELPEGGSVQLMTAHAAKGLGFDMTILAQTDRAAGATSRKVRSGELGNPPQKYFCIKSLDREDSKKETALWAMLRRDDAARERAELKRQLYVACTRAKEHLVLLEPSESRPNSWGKWLQSVRDIHGLQRYTYARLQQLKAEWPQKIEEKKFEEIGSVQEPLDGTELPAEISVSQLLDYLFPQAEKEVESDEEVEQQTLLIGAKERGSLIHRLLEWDGKSTFAAIENLMQFNGLPVSDSKSMYDLAQAVRAELLQLPFDHPNAKQEFAFVLPAAKLRDCVGDIELDKNLKEWLAADDSWCNGIIDYLVPLQSGGYAILDFKTHWNPAAQHLEATRKRIKKQLQFYAVAAKQLGFDVKKLYAMRIYGNSGEINLDEFEEPRA
jgi:ATP-dependent helicase/nuclease subunit A